MDRKSFIQLLTLGSAAGIAMPTTATEEPKAMVKPNGMAGGVYYTKDNPGRWGTKVGGHFPVVTVSGKRVQIVTPHEMNEFEHYIVKHVVLDDNFDFIDEKRFNPKVDKAPISKFTLADYSGRIHVLSVCNLHDTWMNTAEIV